MDKRIEETLSLSPLFVTLTEDEKNALIQKLLSHISDIQEHEDDAPVS